MTSRPDRGCGRRSGCGDEAGQEGDPRDHAVQIEPLTRSVIRAADRSKPVKGWEHIPKTVAIAQTAALLRDD